MTKDEVEHLGFLLVVEPNSGTKFPPEIDPLLTKFSDVVPKDVLPGLPPMRDIQHAIDFFPGAVIPNKPDYHMSPQEYTEVQRQVEGLLKKGTLRSFGHNGPQKGWHMENVHGQSSRKQDHYKVSIFDITT